MTHPLADEARAMLEGVTEGDWFTEGPDHSIIVWSDTDHRVCFMTSDGNPKVNAAFIAWARNNVPKLIDALEAAEAKVRDMALDVLAASGQAQEAHEAQLAAEAKLAEVEKERDSAKGVGITAIEVAEAHIATLTAQVEAMRGADWQPIETAPKGVTANGKLAVSWMMLAIPDGEGGFHRETGMRVGDRFFAALTFYCGGRFDEKQYELREVEVHPTYWMPRPEAPALTTEDQTNG